MSKNWLRSITVEWNPRFTRRMGDATYNQFSYKARIRLSLPLWPRASEQDRRDTVIHEAAHIIVRYQNPDRFFLADHGPEWRQAMRNCGVKPLRTHSVDRSGLARRQRLFVLLDCPQEGIEHKCRISVREYNRIKRGAEFWCRDADWRSIRSRS